MIVTMSLEASVGIIDNIPRKLHRTQSNQSYGLK